MATKSEPLTPKTIEAKVRVTLLEGETSGDESVEFDCIWQSDTDPSHVWHSGPIDLPEDSGEHTLEFTLDDKSGKNLKFYEQADDAMWVDVEGCPKSDPGNGKNNGQIHSKHVDKATKKKLTLNDFNKDDPCLLPYTLRFTGVDWYDPIRHKACPPYEYDPEIKNGGG